jgi:hypothetical protein
MKNLLTLLIATLLGSTYLSAQQTFYTTGDGTGLWQDSQSWSLSETETVVAGIPGPQDHVVIRHGVTHFPSKNYTHSGNIVIDRQGSYEIVSGLESDGLYTYAGKLIEVTGQLIVTQPFRFQQAHATIESKLIFEPGALATFTRDFTLDGRGQLIANNEACGATKINGNFMVHSDQVNICGQGKIVVNGSFFASLAGQDLQGTAAEDAIRNQLCKGFNFYASDEACANDQPAITGFRTYLPEVDLLSFMARPAEAGSVTLSWATAQEDGVTFFLERSTDGTTFEVIGQVDGQGLTQTRTEYQHQDPRPLAGTSFYRLRQQDRTGFFLYSEVVSLRSDAPALELFPNPAQSGPVSLRSHGFQPHEALTVQVRNLMGQVIARQQTSADGQGSFQSTIEAPAETGFYVLQVQGQRKQLSQRLQVD